MNRLTRDNFFQRCSYALLVTAVVSLPLSRFLMLPIAILLLLLFIADNRYREHFKAMRASRLLPAFYITASLFVLSLIGATYSANLSKAISDWECKLWFLAAPLCILPLCSNISLKQIRLLLIAFIASVTATAIGNIVISTAKFAHTGDMTQFFYLNATHFFGDKATHPSYLSLYCSTAWVMVVTYLAKKTFFSSKATRGLLWIALFTLPVEIILLQSKAGLLMFALLFVCTIIYFIVKRIYPLWTGMAILAGCAGICVAVIMKGDMPVNRLSEMLQQLNANEMQNPRNGSLQRLAVWRTSSEAAVDNLPFGTGNGDIRDELCIRYEAKGYTYILNKRLNCHNQYLQHLVSLGIPGLIALLLFIGIPMWEGIKRRNFLLGMWGVLVAGNLLVESMLETRAGSNFIPVMTALLLINERITQSEAENQPNIR